MTGRLGDVEQTPKGTLLNKPHISNLNLLAGGIGLWFPQSGPITARYEVFGVDLRDVISWHVRSAMVGQGAGDKDGRNSLKQLFFEYQGPDADRTMPNT